MLDLHFASTTPWISSQGLSWICWLGSCEKQMPGENEKAEKFPWGNACKEEKEEETGVGGESLQSICLSPGKGGR